MDLQLFLRNINKREERTKPFKLPSDELEKMAAWDIERISLIKAELEECKKISVIGCSSALVSHLSNRIYYFTEVLKVLNQYQIEIQHVLRKRKCKAILAKLGGWLRQEPWITKICTLIPLDICRLIDMSSNDRYHAFREKYAEWKETIVEEPKKLRLQEELFFIYSYFDKRSSYTELIVSIFNEGVEEPLEFFYWFDRVYILNNSVIPTIVIDELLERGLREEEIQTLFPEHKLPTRRLD